MSSILRDFQGLHADAGHLHRYRLRCIGSTRNENKHTPGLLRRHLRFATRALHRARGRTLKRAAAGNWGAMEGIRRRRTAEGAAAVAMHLAYEVKIADWRDAETGLCVVEQSLGVGFKGRYSRRMAYAGRGVYRAHISSLGIYVVNIYMRPHASL